MKSSGHINSDAIIAAATFNKTFKTLYREFENGIFLKIHNKIQEHQSLSELIKSGCAQKHSYFLGATYYMRCELTLENTQELRDTMFSELYPVIINLNKENIALLLRCILQSISKMILQMDLILFDDLMNIDFRKLLLSSSEFMKSARTQCKDIDELLQSLPAMREKYSQQYDRHIAAMLKYKYSIWRLKDLETTEYNREIESQFVLNSFKINEPTKG